MLAYMGFRVIKSKLKPVQASANKLHDKISSRLNRDNDYDKEAIHSETKVHVKYQDVEKFPPPPKHYLQLHPPSPTPEEGSDEEVGSPATVHHSQAPHPAVPARKEAPSVPTHPMPDRADVPHRNGPPRPPLATQLPVSSPVSSTASHTAMRGAVPPPPVRRQSASFASSVPPPPPRTNSSTSSIPSTAPSNRSMAERTSSSFVSPSARASSAHSVPTALTMLGNKSAAPVAKPKRKVPPPPPKPKHLSANVTSNTYFSSPSHRSLAHTPDPSAPPPIPGNRPNI
ncbi:hypothetical protein SJAG_02412 [Schizosaccharomyces japonicus yFS275]|uniref:Uncharacterized protein n=1 Tax=Schizosaccharomyces japonicus (strain yFS275 / FY16936) TaxID=402676 RepID=B6K2E4_SCHJY|nr:hypothetical protein SJAG_02412 [Schizosaccharomyces japonicus yFS275]EEB07325.2 hypothetical protein SJAG_02412 [Schizosaccharomyces japonicus yFS275]